MACWGLTNTGLDDIAEVDLFHNGGVDLGLLEGTLEGDDTELRSGQCLQGTVD